MKNDEIKIGLVVPIYLSKFVKQVITDILRTAPRKDMVLCIVNDGIADVKKYLDEQQWPQNVEILNLPQNRCFAGANNAGWNYMIEKYPSIKYLGSINDDTIPKIGWLDAMFTALEVYPQTALSMPVMETNQGLFHTKKNFATWRLKGSDEMENIDNNIKEDTFVSSVNGFCFLAQKAALLEVDMFDESFRNGCEDADLGIRLLLKGWRMIVCVDSFVFHYGGSSRYVVGTNTNLDLNHKILACKYGGNIEKFNNLNQEGFLIKKYD